MLLLRALVGFIVLFAIVTGAFFGSAGSVHDGRAELMFAVFFGCAGVITIWLWFRDPALLERRVNAGPGSEPDPTQNKVQALATLVFLAIFVVPGLVWRLIREEAFLTAHLAGYGDYCNRVRYRLVPGVW